MKKIQIISIFIFTAIAIGSCAKTVTEGVNESTKRFFDAWLSQNAPNTTRSGRGIYEFPESTVEGEGTAVAENGYVMMRYTQTNLDGTITDYTDKETALQLGTFKKSGYYGAKVFTTAAETIQAGLYDAVVGMKPGGKKKFIVPSWLMSYENFSSENEYLKKDINYNNTIYDIEVIDFTTNINDWQIMKMVESFKSSDFYNGAFSSIEAADSTSKGLYFKMLNKIPSASEFKKDTTFYINYTGRLLDDPDFGDGLIFDTTIENVAKDNNLYSSSKTYKPMAVKWGETHSEITLGGSTVVSGFSQTLWNMVNCGPGTKAVGVFYSPLGYSYSGSGVIPPYAPLIFEIEIVEDPE